MQYIVTQDFQESDGDFHVPPHKNEAASTDQVFHQLVLLNAPALTGGALVLLN